MDRGWQKQLDEKLDKITTLKKRDFQVGWVIAEKDIPEIIAFISQVEAEAYDRGHEDGSSKGKLIYNNPSRKLCFEPKVKLKL